MAGSLVQPTFRESLVLGNRTFFNQALLTALGCYTLNNNYATPRKANGAGAGYVVPASKTFTVVGGKIIIYTAAANTNIALGYSDTDLGMDSASAPVNPIYMFNDSIAASFGLGNTIAGVTGPYTFDVPDFVIPTGKYLLIRANGAKGAVHLYGLEA